MTNGSLLANLAAVHGFRFGAISRFGAAEFAAAYDGDGNRLFLGAALARKCFPDGFAGTDFGSVDGFLRVVSPDAALAELFRSIFPWSAPHVDLPPLPCPEDGADALVFQRVELGDQSGYSLTCPLAANTALPPGGFSDYVCRGDGFSPVAAADAGGNGGGYAGRTFVIGGGEGIAFDAEQAAFCRRRYGNMLPKLVFWYRALRKMRGDDFSLIVELDAPARELLYLAREIRALKLSHIAFRVPVARQAEARRILIYGDFPLDGDAADGEVLQNQE